MNDIAAPVLQPSSEIEAFYAEPDPWRYDSTPDDRIRQARLLAQLPTFEYNRVLDIGCGNGFVTVNLPGSQIIGCDISANAIRWATERAAARGDRNRFSFEVQSVFDLRVNTLGCFDLIIITGVLYPQYIGNSFTLVRYIVDSLLLPSGILAVAHIADWSRWRFPYTLVSADIYDYRKFVHAIEVFIK